MDKEDFNPNSHDAMFATIIAVLKAQDEKFQAKAAEDRAAFREIMAKQDLTNGRVRTLEAWKIRVRGEYVGVAGVVTVLGFIIANWSSLRALFS